jgi:hypothetical protein
LPIEAQILGDCFLQSKLSQQPKKKQKGDHVTYSWETSITPLKTGKQEISFQVSCRIQVLRNMGFFTFPEENIVELVSRPIAMDIDSLGETPSEFRGAIGQFTLTNLRLSSDRALLGEPVTLSVDVEGKGNFTRLQAPEMTRGEHWTLFPPKSTFIAQDDYDFQGIKTWEYVIIPRKTGTIAVPDLSLTYFNPETEKFETITMDNRQKTILVSRSGEAFPGYENSTFTEKPKTDSDTSPSSIHILTKDTAHYISLIPSYRRSWFWILQGFLGIMALVFALKIRKPPLKKRKLKWNMKKNRELLMQKARDGDVKEFYKTATSLLDQRLTLLGISLEQQRSIQIQQLQGKQFKHLKWLESFFNEADAIVFGRLSVDGNHLHRQREKILLFLEQKIDKI